MIIIWDVSISLNIEFKKKYLISVFFKMNDLSIMNDFSESTTLFIKKLLLLKKNLTQILIEQDYALK